MFARNRLFLNSLLMALAGLCLSAFLFFWAFGVIHQRTTKEMTLSAVNDAREYLSTYAQEASSHMENLWTRMSSYESVNEVRMQLDQHAINSQSSLIYSRLLEVQKLLEKELLLDEVYMEAAIVVDGEERDYLCATNYISDNFERDYKEGLLSFENVSYEDFWNVIRLNAGQRYIREPMAVLNWNNNMCTWQKGATGLFALRCDAGGAPVYAVLFVDIDQLQSKLSRFHYAGDFFMLMRDEEVVYTSDPAVTLTQRGDGLLQDGVTDTMYMRIRLDKLGMSCCLSLNNEAIYSGISHFTFLLKLIPWVFVLALALMAALLFIRWHYPVIRMAQNLGAKEDATALGSIRSHIVSLKEENHAMATRLVQLEPAAYKHLMTRLYTSALSPADAAQVRKATGLAENCELRCVCIGSIRGGRKTFEEMNTLAQKHLPGLAASMELDGLFAAVIPWEDDPAALMGCLSALLDALNAGESRCAMGLSDTYRGCSGVAQAWKEAHFSWTDALIWQNPSVVSGASMLKTNRYNVDYEQLDHMYQALRGGDVELAVQIFDGLVQQNFAAPNESRLKQLYCQQFYYDIVGVLARVATTHDVFSVLEELFVHGRQVSLEEQIFLLRSAVQDCAGVIPLKKENNELSSQICAFCEAHFSDPSLSLAVVAEQFELSESGMSKFFKTHTGVTFSSFIENLRMSHAEQLLLDGELNVRSIAEQVGYQNPTTFYNAFKRKHSCTPTQWLNLHQPM